VKAFAGSIVPVFWMFILKFMLSKQHKIVFKYILVGLNKINFLPKAEFLQLETSATSIIKVQETQLPVEACQTHRHSQNSGADFAKNFTFTKRSMDVWSPRCPIPPLFPPKAVSFSPFFSPGVHTLELAWVRESLPNWYQYQPKTVRRRFAAFFVGFSSFCCCRMKIVRRWFPLVGALDRFRYRF